MDAAGNMFGVTYQGGTSNLGTVYEMKAGSNNKYTHKVLYSFKGGTTDGEYPWLQNLTLDSNDNIFGTTRHGGSSYNEGTVWELKLVNGKYKEIRLHVFEDTSGNDGYHPLAGVILVKGNLYGTAFGGGTHRAGTAFRVTP